MKRHVASRQKPVPKLASMSSLGPSFPEIRSFTEGVIFTEVIGTTISLKSWVCSTVEEGGMVEGLERTFWAAAIGDRQEHAIRVGMISREITTHPRSPRTGDASVLHVLFHRASC